MENKSNFLKGALVLSIAGAISKILGAVYRIPLARLLGGEGMGLYQMAYPIYTTILALATAGVPVAISVLVSRKETQGYNGDSKRIFRVSLIDVILFRNYFDLANHADSSFSGRYVFCMNPALITPYWQ